MGAQYHHGDLAQRGIFPLLRAELPPIHHRHHHVQEDHARRALRRAKLVERSGAVRGAQRAIVAVLQHLCDGIAGVDVVLHDEDGLFATRIGHARAPRILLRFAAGARPNRGRSMQKVDPSPTELATAMVPRCASTMYRVM